MSFWLPRLASLGLEFWLFAALAMVGGWVLARHLQRPGPAEGLVSRISLWRSVVGIGFIVVLSWPHRSMLDIADTSVGSYTISIVIASVVALLSLFALFLASKGADRERIRRESGPIVDRVAGLFAGLVPLVGTSFLIERTNPPQWVVLGLFGVFLGCVSYYVATFWYVSRHWFGLNDAHPLLGPAVTAVTVCAIAAVELRFDGPGPLPVRTWLLITAGGLVTTLGICLWEVLDQGPARWPVVVAASAVASVMVAGVFLVASAERLCGVINCAYSPDAAEPPEVAVPFELRAPGAIDLNRGSPTNDLTFADLIYEPRWDGWGNVLHTNGAHALAAWTVDGLPDRNRCDNLLNALGWPTWASSRNAAWCCAWRRPPAGSRPW